MLSEEAAADAPSWVTRTASEIRRVGQRDGSVAVVPVGSVEQHGNHLPVGTDAILAEVAANAGAERVSDDAPILVTPTIWTGLSPHHADFGGTITLRPETMLPLLRDVAASVFENDFDAVLFLNGHGGNRALLGTAVTKIGAEFPDDQVLAATYFELVASFVDEVRESESGGMAHGGEFETSLVLHLYPELVREEEVDGTYMDDPYDDRATDLFESGSLSVYRSFTAYSDSGAVGDPALADAETGAAILERLADELEALLLAIHEHNE